MRAEIEKYLGTVMQSTAKTIADRVGADRLLVSRELNAMVSCGILERKLEGVGGRHSEYIYWLTRKDAQPVSKEDHKESPKSLLEAVVTAGNNASPKVAKPEVTDAELGTVEEALDLALQLQAVIRERDDLRVQHGAVVDSFEVYRTAAVVEIDGLKEVITKLRANNAALERRIDELTLVDAEFVPSQVFVTLGRTAAPKRHRTLEKAQRRAQLLVRTDKESEVLVLEPVGRVVRGAEWRSQ
ncbi:hypothetical protein [Paraburkholderia rhynchosiae]|uniref:Uncharacterized protein n=1 Tax=Paraburkholderia rhynchosiae TaxID=487049 RepID=A0A2N7W977_9BURK|nr:hypothetical protein [Paraburkholderia rhynchosiae]PMS25957.1 hypothetical protein C0Z16_27875 [Paraburkholderia rhynchosiae]CAB3730459.1 hypothetical protein LMG27174_05746 [Paraburkholderia rhynchosiae]